MSNFEPSGGPKDRFKKANKQANNRQKQAEFIKEAEAKNAEGQYLCADCRLWYAIEDFQYVHEGETKVARRCESCRQDRRSRHHRWANRQRGK